MKLSIKFISREYSKKYSEEHGLNGNPIFICDSVDIYQKSGFLVAHLKEKEVDIYFQLFEIDSYSISLF